MYEGEGLIELLIQQGIQFGIYHEGQVNIPAVCPFHVDDSGRRKTPFYVYVGAASEKKSPGASFCHRCDEGWSLPSLLTKLGSPRGVIDQVQAYLKDLRGSAKPRKGTNGLVTSFRYTLPEALLGIWDFTPRRMLEWGFTQETIDHFDVGFDRMNKRITFPIRDHHGLFVGVSGRATRPWQTARYRVYKEELTEIHRNYEMRKGLALWGLDKFYVTRMQATKPQPPIVMNEGFKAAMWVWQCGVPHVCASMGSALTNAQIRLLTCCTSELIMFWDNDLVGRRALLKTGRRLREHGLIVRPANYETSEPISPDDLSPERVLRAVAKSLTFRQWSKLYGNV